VKLTDALRGVRQLAIDTSPLIYFIERHASYFDRMAVIMKTIDTGTVAGVSATIALTEVLVQPNKTGDTALASRYEAVLTHSRSFRLEPMTTQIARRAAYLRATYNLRTPDAIHMATALETGCDAFLTNDLGLRRVTLLPVLVLDELELDPPKV
jgi:predicted nucleic acid-binding protein